MIFFIDMIPTSSLCIMTHPFLLLTTLLHTSKNDSLSNAKFKITVTAQNTAKHGTPFLTHKINVGDPVVSNTDTMRQEIIIVPIERLNLLTILEIG